MTLSELCERAHANSRAKGWYDVPHDKRNIGEMLMLIVTEVAEAMEDYRADEMVTRYDDGTSDIYDTQFPDPRCRVPLKPIGFPSELADIVIRVGDLCGYLGIDLEKEVREKMDYNRTRLYRHGDKKA